MNLKRFFALMLAIALSLTMLQGVAFGVTPAPDGLYSAIVRHDNGEDVYMQVRIDGNNVVLGAGSYSVNILNPQFASCLRTTHEEPANITDKMYTGYTGVFDIDDMYDTFKTSTIYVTSGNTVTYTFPSAITQIGHGAFEDWKPTTPSPSQTLTSVIIPSSITELGSNALANSSVTTVDFSQATNLAKINSSTFNGCASLTSIDLSNTKITRLETSSFISCKVLTSVKLPDTLTRIENTAFMNTYNLTSLTIPPNVTSITSNAFEDDSLSPKTKTLKFTGDFNKSFYDLATDTKTYVKLLYPAGNPTWENSPEVKSLVAQGKAASYILSTTTTAGGGSTGGGAGAWYIGTGVPYTQIVDETATTAMLETGNVITVIGQSPTGIIVKLDPTALQGHSTVTINNSIQDVSITATQIANLVAKAEGSVIYITIKQTADGVSISVTAGGVQETL